MKEQILVVGCGIIGLTSAIRLQEAGYEVRIVARDLPPSTTSNKAAAVWQPYRAEPQHLVDAWAATTYRVYEDEQGEGLVEMVEIFEVAKKELEKPFWLRPEYPYRRLEPDEKPQGYDHGFAVRVPFVHSARYLQHLMDRFATGGGDVHVRSLASLDDLEDLATEARAIVHCAGLGARELANDPEVFPIRGQLAVVRPSAPVHYMVDEHTHDDPVYVLPRGDECILGGTAQEHDDTTDEDLATRENILARCRTLQPALEGATFLRPVVGLRPGRSTIRLELEPEGPAGRPVVHNYGHGGSGFTVAWGCADEVVEYLRESAPALKAGPARTRKEVC